MRSDATSLFWSQILYNRRLPWLVAVATSFVVLIGSVAGPRPAFASLCHQLADRSFDIDGHLFAVCHRCTGIYLGIASGLILSASGSVSRLARRHGLVILAVALAMILVDVGLDVTGILSNTVSSRFLTGLLLGTAGGGYLGAAIIHSNPEAHDR